MAKDTLVMSWKDIAGYEGYQAHPDGMIRNKKTGRVLKCLNNGRYLYADLKGKNVLIHRIIATTFLENPDNLPCVNHKNQNKMDNRASNLEFCTQQYNAHYSKVWVKANEGAIEKCSKPVLQFTKDGELINEYYSVREASRQTGIFSGSICNCCNGKSKSAGNYTWKYKE